MASLENYLTVLDQYFYPHTIEELIGTLIVPIRQHLMQLKTECEMRLNIGYGIESNWM